MDYSIIEVTFDKGQALQKSIYIRTTFIIMATLTYFVVKNNKFQIIKSKVDEVNEPPKEETEKVSTYGMLQWIHDIESKDG